MKKVLLDGTIKEFEVNATKMEYLIIEFYEATQYCGPNYDDSLPTSIWHEMSKEDWEERIRVKIFMQHMGEDGSVLGVDVNDLIAYDDSQFPLVRAKWLGVDKYVSLQSLDHKIYNQELGFEAWLRSTVSELKIQEVYITHRPNEISYDEMLRR